MKQETHLSQSTPPGRGAISIIRISGPGAVESISKICDKNILPIKHKRPTLTTLYDADSSPIDSAIVTLFPKPNSYTGEDVVELSCHGNPHIVDAVVEALLKTGVRISEPGEFTRDAFLNGKIDLVQAESIGNLVSSRSMVAAKMSLRILNGGLTKRLINIRDPIIELLSQYEFGLDISEDDSFSLTSSRKAISIISKCIQRSNSLIKTYSEALLYNQGLRVAIIGKPNVGKSTLLNCFVGKERVITSDIPGTTRDTIEASFLLREIPITLVDTAGIRDPANRIEGLGVQRSINEAKNCDIVINLLTPKSFNQDFLSDSVPVICVINKIDTLTNTQKTALSKKTETFLYISALFNIGVAALKDEIYKQIKYSNTKTPDIAITTKRQKQSLVSCVQNLTRARSQLKKTPPFIELICVDLKNSISSLDSLLGKTTEEDILNNIFNNFCVGK